MTILLCTFACNALAKNAVWVSVPHSSLCCALHTTEELGGILATVPPRHCCMGNSKNKEEKIFYRLVASMQQLSEWQGWTEALKLLCSQVGQDNPPRVTRLHTTRSPPSPSSQAGRAQREIFSQLGNDGWDRVRGRQAQHSILTFCCSHGQSHGLDTCHALRRTKLFQWVSTRFRFKTPFMRAVNCFNGCRAVWSQTNFNQQLFFTVSSCRQK